MITFRKSKAFDGYFVYRDDIIIGSVVRNSIWTVRGSRIVWDAWRKGFNRGSAATRKDAAALLEK